MRSIKGKLILYKEGKKLPFHTGYRPLFNIKDNKYSGKISLKEKKQLFPGESCDVAIDFLIDNLDIQMGDILTFDEGTNKKIGEVEVLAV